MTKSKASSSGGGDAKRAKKTHEKAAGTSSIAAVTLVPASRGHEASDPVSPFGEAAVHLSIKKKLEEAEADLVKMKELHAGAVKQKEDSDRKAEELQEHLEAIKGALRLSFTSLHQTAIGLGIVTES
uniref:Uncharacterized protein n=1 Tax=Leersia perrieri TaxID=77586 RepID=A0A0D9W2C9_9ORYZ